MKTTSRGDSSTKVENGPRKFSTRQRKLATTRAVGTQRLEIVERSRELEEMLTPANNPTEMRLGERPVHRKQAGKEQILLRQPGARAVKNGLTDLCKAGSNTWARQQANIKE